MIVSAALRVVQPRGGLAFQLRLLRDGGGEDRGELRGLGLLGMGHRRIVSGGVGVVESIGLFLQHLPVQRREHVGLQPALQFV